MNSMTVNRAYRMWDTIAQRNGLPLGSSVARDFVICVAVLGRTSYDFRGPNLQYHNWSPEGFSAPIQAVRSGDGFVIMGDGEIEATNAALTALE